MNSFAGIFWLVLAQLQNRVFVEHLPVAAYVRCLKEKEWKKWNSVFSLYCLTFFCGIARFSRGNKNKLRTFQPQKWNKIKNSQPQTKFTGSYKKKECISVNSLKIYFIFFNQFWALSPSSSHFLYLLFKSKRNFKRHLISKHDLQNISHFK